MSNLNIGNQGKAGVVRSNFPVKVPQSMKFPGVVVGMPQARDETKLPSDNNTYGTNTQRIVKFVIPNEHIVDFRQGYVAFDLTVTVTGGTYARLAQGVWSAFDRVRIKGATSGEVEDLRMYNLLQTVLYEALVEEGISGTLGESLWGVGTTVQRNAWAAGKRYGMPLLCGLLSKSVLPLKFMTDVIEVELYLADPSTCVETDGSDPVITLNNLKLHYEKIRADRAYEQNLKDQIATKGINFHFKSYEHFGNNVTAARTSNQINHRADSVDFVINLFRDQNTMNDPTVNDKFLTWGKNNVTQYQTMINGERHPEEPIECQGDAIQAYITLLKWQRKWVVDGLKEDPPTIDGAAFNSNKFLMIQDLRAHLESDVINPRGTATHSADMQLDVLMSAAPGTPLQLDSFVGYHMVVNISPSGKLQRGF
jgi:hypothetical protein